MQGSEIQLHAFYDVQRQSRLTTSTEEVRDRMESQNWIVTDDSQCLPFEPREFESPVEIYRLYRFLTDLEDILQSTPDDYQRLQSICPLVRTLLTSSYWIQMENPQPSAKRGWAIRTLYKEPKFPLTVQLVTWLPGQVSKIHNHAAWGIVALISGEEKNTFWRRTADAEFEDRIEPVGEQVLVPGDIIGFMPDAIHHVEPLGDEPTITFNLYGEANYDRRFQFDAISHTAKNF